MILPDEVALRLATSTRITPPAHAQTAARVTPIGPERPKLTSQEPV